MITMQEDPQKINQLIDELREEIHRLIEVDNSEGKRAMETQLGEIARAIANLEKKQIFVPEVLRAEKTRLIAAVDVKSEAARLLSYLIQELESIIREFKPLVTAKRDEQTGKKIRRSRSRTPKTSNQTLRKLIIEALQHYGGSATKRDVHTYIGDALKDKLLPGDLEWRESTRDLAWQNNTDWERNKMRLEGVIKSGSPTGIWELSEEYL